MATSADEMSIEYPSGPCPPCRESMPSRMMDGLGPAARGIWLPVVRVKSTPVAGRRYETSSCPSGFSSGVVMMTVCGRSVKEPGCRTSTTGFGIMAMESVGECTATEKASNRGLIIALQDRAPLAASASGLHIRAHGSGPSRRYRLRHHGGLLRDRAGDRHHPPPLRPHRQRLLPRRTSRPRLDRLTRVPLGEPRRPGSDRDGGFGRQLRRRDQPLLLGWRHPGDGLRRAVHDALLLWIPCAVGPRIP